MGLLVVTLGLSFTGYLLPVGPARVLGDHHRREHRAVAARDHRRSRSHRVVRSRRLAEAALLGSDQVGEEALIRFYLLHVMILPPGCSRCFRCTSGASARTAGSCAQVDADRRLGPVHAADYPVFTEAPRKTYQLAAVVRG
jgi:hypothetical protein